jgi:ABC-type nitrate/sulfonate/bicarbonate transport system permease component
LGLNTWELITELFFWEALPSILNGVRVSVSYSLVLVIAVEMFIGVGDSGLGRRIYDFQSTYQIPEAYSVIILTSIIGILLNWFVTIFEKFIMKWYSSK